MASGQTVNRTRPNESTTEDACPAGPAASASSRTWGGWKVEAMSSSGRPSSPRGARATIGAQT
eukprot:4083903-Alexandrium_andersonii.AAC.1